MNPAEKQLAASVAGLVHKQVLWEAAQNIVDACKIKAKFKKDSAPDKVIPVIQFYLHELMESGGMAEAAQILWTPNQFTPEPNSVQRVWGLFERSSMGLIMGAASLGKSFSMGVRLFLEWLRDPEWTSVRVIGPSEDHLEQNLFSHLVALHQRATLPMPGEIGDLYIGLDRRNQVSSIRGIVVPKGNSKKAGRLQGGHRKPRVTRHPIFGDLSRMFIFIDEIENVPMGIWHDVENVLSETGTPGFKLFGAYNPTDMSAEVAIRAEPTFGWEHIDEDTHYEWNSIRGWDVVRLDAEQCENVIQGKVIYPGLQTREGLERIAKSAGGRQSAHYMTMGRGMYPRQGIEVTVIPPGMLPKMRGEFIWLDAPQPVAAEDLALDGGDDAIYTLGKWGLATGMILPPSIDFPDGQRVMFKNKSGIVTPRWALQADSQLVLPKGDTVPMKDRTIDINKKAGVRPEYFACDRTGHGRGVADLIKYEWSAAIHDINYSESATKDKLMTEDSKTCEEQYERMATELWFAMRIWGEFGYLLINPKMDMSKLSQQLTQRRFRTNGTRTKVESKKDYMSRGFGSPNEADSLSLLVYAARKGSGVILSMKGEAVMPSSTWEDDWPNGDSPNGVRIDPSNRSEFLDSRPDPFDGPPPRQPEEFSIL